MSVSTTRLLKAVLPSQCLWTSLRESEGLTYEKTIRELKTLYPATEEDDDTSDNVYGLSSAVPEAIRSMLMYHGAVEALGSMIWYRFFGSYNGRVLIQKLLGIFTRSTSTRTFSV